MKKGEKMSSRQRARISATLLGHLVSKQTRIKMSKTKKKNPTRYWLGKKIPLRVRLKMSTTKRKSGTLSYQAMHKRLRYTKGNAAHCSNIYCPKKSRTYDWANLSGKYLGLDDFIPLCRSCHTAWDKRNYKINGTGG